MCSNNPPFEDDSIFI